MGKRSIAGVLVVGVYGLASLALWAVLFLALTTLIISDEGGNRHLWAALAGTLTASAGLNLWAPVKRSLHSLSTEGISAPALGTLAAVCLVLGGVVCGASAGVRAHWHAKLEAAKAQLKAKGLPVTLAAFQTDLPEDQYARPAWATALDKDFDPAAYDKVKRKDEAGAVRWTRQRYAAEAECVAHYAPFVDKELAPLMKRKYARYMKTDYAKAAAEPLSAPAPDLKNVLKAARVLRLSAAARAFKGDAAGAWELIRALFSMSDAVASDPSILAKMAALGLRRQAAGAALDVMLNRPEASAPEDVAARLGGVLSADLVTEGLKGELAYMSDVYAWLDRQPGRSLAGAFSGSSLGDGGLFASAAGAVFKAAGAVDLNGLALTRGFALMLGADPVGPTSVEEAQAWMLGRPAWPYFLSQVAMPAFGSLQRREKEIKTWAQLALAVSSLNHRRRAGLYPAETEDKDPYSGKPLLYAVTDGGKGFDLCSAGEKGNKKDFAGVELCVHERPL